MLCALQDAMVPALTADASMLAAEFHRGLDEITESCKQVRNLHVASGRAHLC